MTKKNLIEKLNKLPWGEVLYGYDKDGKIINVNEYNEETDTFNTYGEDFRCHQLKFKDLPSVLKDSSK